MTNVISPSQNFDEAERPQLQKLFISILIYSGLLLVLTLILTVFLINTQGLDFVWISISAGILGSTLSSLTSVLNRRAGGFDLY